MWLFFKFTTKNTKAVCQKKSDAYAHIKKIKARSFFERCAKKIASIKMYAPTHRRRAHVL